MSHFTRVETKLKDAALLIEALTSLGYTVREESSVQGIGVTSGTMEIAAASPDGFEIGFVRKGETYEIVADWWGREDARDALPGQIAQAYAAHAAVGAAKAAGWRDVQIVKSKAGELQVLAVRG